MTWAEFVERYRDGLGHRSVNYTHWIVLTTSQINRIAGFFAFGDSLDGEWTASGRTHDGRNVTLTFKHNIGRPEGIFSSDAPVPFVRVEGNGIHEDGFAYLLANRLLMDRRHAALTLMDSDLGYGMRRGSLMLVPKGSMQDPPVEEPSEVCWPRDHDFDRTWTKDEAGTVWRVHTCMRCGFSYRVSDREIKENLRLAIEKLLLAGALAGAFDPAQVSRRNRRRAAWRKKKARRARRRSA